jgi:hypothetical protein
MSAGFCLHCGLKIDDDGTAPGASVHHYCMQAYQADQAAAAKAPKTQMEQQLDRIEGLLMAIRDRYSL